jgi:hypothetical protein
MFDNVLLQAVVHQRGMQPTGQRILTDGTLQVTTADNPMPGPDDLLEKDRSLSWETVRQLSNADVQALEAAIRQSGVLDLPPRILINYCKEDPGTQILTINLGDHKHRVVLYDPKPRRSVEIDALLRVLNAVIAGQPTGLPGTQ